jgi:hypothetical protein
MDMDLADGYHKALAQHVTFSRAALRARVINAGECGTRSTSSSLAKCMSSSFPTVRSAAHWLRQ